MADQIEKIESLAILAILGGIVGVGIWAFLKFRNRPDGSGGWDWAKIARMGSDFAGGAGAPGSAEYVSPVENVKRWATIISGSQADQDYNNDPSPGTTVLASQEEQSPNLTPQDLLTNPFLAGEYLAAVEDGTVAGTAPDGTDPGNAITNWALTNRLF